MDLIWHIHRFLANQQCPVASAAGFADCAGSLSGSFDYVIPRGRRDSNPKVLSSSRANWWQSPRWLIDHGHHEEGLKTLARLHAHGDENNAWVRAEYNQIQETITFEHENEAKSYIELFSSRSSFRRLFLCCALQASVQMTGVSAIQ